MSIDDRQAKQICTKDEYALYRSSRDPQGLPPKERARQLRRARTLRDKYRDLQRRQTRKARGKSGGAPKPLQEARRTELKARLFAEAVERLAPPPPKAEAKRAATPPRKAAPPPSRSPRSIPAAAPPRSTRSLHGAAPGFPGKAVKKVYAKNRFAHYGSATHGRQRRRDNRR